MLLQTVDINKNTQQVILVNLETDVEYTLELSGGDWNILNNQELESSSDYWGMVKLADYVTRWRG